MADIVFFVVCEGSSDFPLIKGIVENIGVSRRKKFETRLIQPQIDATGGQYERGWTAVQAWCLRNAALANEGKRRLEQFLTFVGNGVFLIHLDSDIAHLLKIRGHIFSGGTKQRRSWCERTLNHWLGVYAGQPEFYYLLPTWQIETWILATYDHVTHPEIYPSPVSDYEMIEDVEAKLLEIGYVEDRERPGRLYKESALYGSDSRYLKRLTRNLSVVSTRCEELDRFISMLSSLDA